MFWYDVGFIHWRCLGRLGTLFGIFHVSLDRVEGGVKMFENMFIIKTWPHSEKNLFEGLEKGGLGGAT